MTDKNESGSAGPQPARTDGDFNNTAPGDNSQPGVPVKDIANGIAEAPPIELDKLDRSHPEYERLAEIKLTRDLTELAKADNEGINDEVKWEEAKENREAAEGQDAEPANARVEFVDPAPVVADEE